ncbi:MAG: FtsX-like permease family protein [Fulvivirga sp.]|nr:FtsX-like permease family protein [Fulvivirga sp.]
MLRRHIVLAKRLFFKYPVNAVITISGLSLGLAAFLLLFLYVYDEYKADRFHQHYKNIYKVSMMHYVNGEPMFSFPPPAGFKYDLNNIPEIVSNTRARTSGEVVFQVGDQQFFEKGGIYVDSAWLEIFDFEYAYNSFDFVNDPGKIAISEALAKKYFADRDPIEKTVTIDGEEYLIENIILSPLTNYSLNPKFLIAYKKQKQFGVSLEDYQSGHTPYWIVSNNISEDEIRAKLQKAIDEKVGENNKVELTSFRDYYFDQGSYYGNEKGTIRGNKKYYHVFIWVAIIVLVLAVINYVNLNTARATDRAKEVGIKKTIGARPGGLIKQFLVESVVLTFLAGLLAIGILELVLPFFNSMLVRPITEHYLLSPTVILALLLLFLIIGTAAGLYPAFILSNYKPSLVLKGRVESQQGNNWVRNVLITGQFAIASLLIFGCLVVRSQMNFLSDFELGVDSDKIISIKASDETKKSLPVMKNELLGIQGVSHVSTGNLPGIGWMYGTEINGKTASVAIHHVDEDFIETAGLELIEGRNFQPGDSTNKVIINQTLRDLYFGKESTSFGKIPGSSNFIIGVVKDFQITSAANEVMPLEIKFNPQNSMHLLVKVEEGVPMKETLEDIKDVYNKNAPNSVFDYYFLDEQYDSQFKSEMLFLRLLNLFTALSIFIGGIGLFGLAQFSFLKKVKELGIRIVLGASLMSIVKLMVGELLKPVLVALLIGVPLGYYLLDQWLQAYANKVPLSWTFGLATLGVMILIAFTAICYQLLNATRIKPVKVLRNE